MINNSFFLFKFFNRVFIAFVLMSFYACDTTSYVDYNVVNSSTHPLKISFNQWEYNKGMNVTADTTLYLLPNNTYTLTTREIFGGSSIYNPESGNDTIYLLPKLNIYIKDTTHSKDSLRSIKYWNYNRISRHNAELTLEVFDKYF